MPFSLLPRAMFDRLTDIRPEWLKERGVELLLLDFDNTIVPYTTSVPEPAVTAWFSEVLGAGIQLCVVSNSLRARVPEFCEQYGLPYVVRAKKPGTRGIKEALRRFSCPPERAALAGDQIYTDVLGGNCAGVLSILVRPILLHIFPLRLRNYAEQPWIQIAKRRLKS